MFDTIVGNEQIKKQLENAININKTSHSYLFVGIAGIGKRLIAKEFAKTILCLSKEKNCSKCKSCIEFDTNNNPDFIFIEPNNGSIKIDQIRNMQKSVSEKPIISSRKVCIINDADLMTAEAQNCLLKTLEEPPEYMTIILVGTNESNFLATIKSRCTIIHFNRIKDEYIKKYLQENLPNEVVKQEVIDIADGSIGKAIDLNNKSEIYVNVNDIIELIEKCDIIDILKKADIIYKSKDEIFGILEYINVLLINKGKNNYKYANCIEFVEETKKRIKSNSNYNMCIDYMLFSIWEEVNEKYSRGQI